MREPRTWQLTACAAVLGLALAAGAVTAAGPWDNGQRKAERARAVTTAPTGGAHHAAPRPAAGPPRPVPAPSAAGVLRALAAPHTTHPGDLAALLVPLLADPGLGPLRTASVVDATTGKQLYGEGATTPMTPASTIKIATTVAALSALGPDHRIPTTVTASPDGRTLTLVGGGDPTLDPARLKTLATDTARALKGRRVTAVRLAYDTSLYTGPSRHPIGPNENIAPVVALMTQEGRLDDSDSGPAPRAADPAHDTATAFAELLAKAGVTVQNAPAPARPSTAPPKAAPLARTYSAPLSTLVERTLTHSDNDLAEALARQTALARKQPASFDGAGRAVRAQLDALGLPTAGARFADGSGLSRADRMSAALLTGLLTRAADPARPALRPVLTGLPIGGFSGTLKSRFDTGPTATGAGLIRAKTGTLTGVNTLAGTVVTADGRLLAFAFLAGRTPSSYTAQPALDRLSAALAPQG
ncbi:D-alanyl-D-alanine carboxypeptidase/D-alanyl-D-alanine-endopeptidase [Streptomyces sp. ISL-36]|uniref:D-alanyl-D-alanine carboxypeptidase/D-alanyl-D-alanine endopeptidase n=1 Tax=Streptomyces sp. ISL-36 TaxID=2819182 RepID=UPI001BE7F10A|nr:D-alanyl-D-alanine carboxypeptidase/D-alanyl-D-alanine-endopeptidase [Streptomyces sp. ISL-36]MBT2440403.1 D-alanyl-D-alanine carboxypeptidase/D-alanyl-D-alanine-endopeptidase [Streptomyces sp. ISL-36]